MLKVAIIELVVLGLSAGLVCWQIYLLKKQMQNQHEEKRRENTVDFMITWCNSVKKDTSIAAQVASRLTEDQSLQLYLTKAFTVNKEIKQDICKFCPLGDGACQSCSLREEGLKVDGKILTELRWHVISYLNTLETVLIAWDLGIVDSATIEAQFQFLRATTKGFVLSNFRKSAGGYPIIQKFLEANKESTQKSKSEL